MKKKDNARTEAARLLGRLSARAATPEQRKDRAAAGGLAAQAKLTPEERSRRAKLRWQRWRENKAKRGQPVANRNPGLRELAHAKAIEAAVSGTAKATMDGTTTMEASEAELAPWQPESRITFGRLGKLWIFSEPSDRRREG